MSSSLPSVPALRLVVTDEAPRSFAELVEAAHRAEREGQRAEARELFHAALAGLTPETGHEASALLRWIGRTYQVDGDLEAALDCLEAALAVGAAYGDLTAVGHAINLQAIVHWHRSDLDGAERLFHHARETALAAGEAKLVAMTAQNLGTIAQIRGDFAQASIHYETSLRDYRTLGLARDVCAALNNLGMLHTGQGRWPEAQAAYEEALQISTVLGDITTRILIEVNYADYFVAQRLFDQARELADSASALATRANDHRADGELHKVYGIIARESGDLAAAERHLGSAQEIAERRGDLLLLADATKAKADLHRLQGRNSDTLHCLNSAHRVFSQLRARRDLADVDSRVTRLEGEFLDVVRKWSESIESKDHYTQGHCERVADLACALAARVGFGEQELFWFRIGAMLHDVGKLLINSEVLNKPGPLTAEEWGLVKQHPVHGVTMLAGVDFPGDVRAIVESHHERWDGQGYPHQLEGGSIPLSARILCIADVYDALTSQRSYKRSLPHYEALDVMRLDVGTQFDPVLFPAFEEVANEMAAQSGAPRLAVARPTAPSVHATPGSAADELTGLPLRRGFLDHAHAVIERNADNPVSLLVIDIDFFKLVNDTFGHLAGDTVLRDVAATLRAQLRPQDFLARYAGDEFVALLAETPSDEAQRIANRLREAVHGLSFGARGAPVATTISVGIAAAPEHGVTIEELFAAADAALYEAKRRGRDTAVLAGTAGHAREPELRIERFAGRVTERNRLTQFVDECQRGAVRVVAVGGEAGIGKSSLVRELSTEVRMRAGSLVLGRCVDGASRSPLAAWVAALRAIRVLRVVAERPWRHLPRLFGEHGPASPSDGTRYALFEEVAEYLRLAAAARPLVIALDDMQWADALTWDLLEHVLARLDRDRICFCLTIRDEDATSEVRARCARLSRDDRFREIRLGRLTKAEQRDWMGRVLGHPAEEALLDRIYAQSEGNPFFSVQILRGLVDERRLHWTGDHWEWTATVDARDATLPVAIRDLLSLRVERLSPTARQMLAGCATIGRAIDVEIAVQAGIGTEEQILDAIDEGLNGSVLEVSDVHGEHAIAFAHTLLVDIVRDSLNPGRRKRLHGRIAAAIETARPRAAVDLAHHYELAGDHQRAFTYGCEAAEQAAAIYANDDALRLLESAERHADGIASRAAVRLRRAALAEAAGHYHMAEELHQSVLTELFSVVDAPRRAESKRAIVRLRSLQGASAETTTVACRELLSEAEALDLDAERLALLLMLSQACTVAGETVLAETLARECLELAERGADRRLVAEALIRVGSSIVHERSREAMSFYRRALSAYEAIHDGEGRIRCQINFGVASSRIGDFDASEAAYREALRHSREIHSPDYAGLASLNLGAVYMKRGRLADARTHLEEAHSLFRKVNNKHHRVGAIYNLAHLARDEQRFDDASRLYAATASLARAVGKQDIVIGATAAAGLMAFALDDRAEAREIARRLADHPLVNLEGWFQGRELLEAFMIRLAVADDDLAAATERFEHAVAIGSDHDAYGTAWLVATTAADLLARVDGDRKPSICEVIQSYARRAETMGSPPLAAHFAALLGEKSQLDTAVRPPRLLVG